MSWNSCLMKEMYGIVDNMRDTFSKKYSPWLDY